MLEQLYQRYHRELLRWCRSMTGDPSVSEDLVQEAFLRAMSNLNLLETLPEAQQRAWFYRTVKNRYLDQLRHSRYETVAESLPESLLSSPEYDRIDWEQLLNGLPDGEGVLFALRYLEGYTSPELGKLFSLPPGTVRSKLSLARKHLKDALKGEKHV